MNHLNDIDAPESAPPTRQRLPALVRVNQILDAALEAFATRGFASTSIDDIAAMAGLSKGGIYTHFKSKDDLFEALLERALTPILTDGTGVPVVGAVTVDVLVEQVLNPMYERLSQRQTMQALRLLFADGSRVPERVAKWRAVAVDPYLATIEKLVRIGIAQGNLREGAITRAPWLLISPGLHAIFWQLIQGENDPELLAEQRQAHIALVREMLQIGKLA